MTRACRVVLALGLLPACTHGSGAAAPSATAAELAAIELGGLKVALAERDQTIQQLEGRLAMLEAAQRQLRGELEAERSGSQHAEVARETGAHNPPPRETVRIGGTRARDKAAPHGSQQVERAAASSAGASQPVESTLESAHEPRPVLRIYNDHTGRRLPEQRELASTWTAPTTSERLTVSPLPSLSSARGMTSARAPESAALGTAVSAPRVSGTTPASVATAQAPAASVASGATTDQDDDLYVHALDLVRRRELPEALRELTAFVRSAPHDPRVARAQFWRGEILFAEGQFARALSAFEIALTHEPSGDKAPDALLRVARCHQRLGATAPARAALLKLRTQFPDSPAARRAEREPELAAQEDT